MEKLREKFEKLYHKTPLLVASPGRVNLIGEHTDYNQGFVLPGAVDKKMFIAVAANGTDMVNLYANEYEETFSFSLTDIKPEKKETWSSYLLGVAYLLQQKGCSVKGVDVLIDGNVPVGAGMSSSAALSCAFSFALNELFHFGLSRVDMAYIGQKTEHIFVGALVGIMDPFASLHGKAGHVIKLDCRSMEFEYIPFNFPNHKIVMVNSMVKHSLAGSEYNVRRKQCEEGVEIMKKFITPEIKSLRDITLSDLEAHKNDLSELVYKRCLYVISENERLLKGSKLLVEGDLAGFGQLMYQTHLGLSKQYEVSCEELDFLADQAHSFEGVTGTRMMGGGFGGCTINLVKQDAVEPFTSFIKSKYEEQFNKDTEVYVTQIEDGTKVIG
ncbi:MAG: galactokinase [Chitinophagaceae bacterium]